MLTLGPGFIFHKIIDRVLQSGEQWWLVPVDPTVSERIHQEPLCNMTPEYCRWLRWKQVVEAVYKGFCKFCGQELGELHLKHADTIGWLAAQVCQDKTT